MASSVNTSSRDWGKGMACVGRTKVCTIVAPNHWGPVPNVPVGSQWKFRVQVSEAGIHRPHVAGIHGRESEGAFSIALAGGYEDDVDNGDTFTYTGSGGRDLSGNKRTAEQSCDQTLTRMNRALATNCNAPLNVLGAEAVDWRKGKPVRVVRSYNGKKDSKYCPAEGIRYDGIYKVVKYWPEKGKSGHIVWRYLLRRDDPAVAPWTEAGKKVIERLGISMEYPDGYLEAQQAKKSKDASDSKRKANGDSPPDAGSKKRKKIRDALPSDLTQLIEQDKVNKKLWAECVSALDEGITEFTRKVEETFMCICCQEVVLNPITTQCQHNICKSCLSRSFKAQVFTCPMCRAFLGQKYAMIPNETLCQILSKLLPGYEKGR